ncbi:MAG: 2-oxoacid:ferredoxin oxidoreductase subunit beta [Candidatus Kapaibacteriota bacterium]
MNNLIDSITSNGTAEHHFTVKDLRPAADVRWCAGCGDYSVLSQVQKLLPELGMVRENIAFVSGIGCSSRFPYYMETYGFHTIHGRAAAVATGLKVARPELSVWVITGDGDALSIGGNHTIHLLRRNVDVNVLLFNNQIYGLTKGQYSPTSQHGQMTKSSPTGMPDYPFNPVSLALGAGGTFVARTLDRDLKHLGAMLRRAADHKGTSFLEIYQNCVVFNDGAFDEFTDKATKPERVLFLEHGQPLIFGANKDKGIRLDGLKPEVVSLASGEYSAEDLVIYDEHDPTLAFLIANLTYNPDFPRPVGVFLNVDRPCYEDEITAQIDAAKSTPKGSNTSLQALFASPGYEWTIS